MTAVPAAASATARRQLPVWLVSVLAGLAAAVTTELYGLVARAVGVPMRAGNIGADHADPVTVGLFAMGVLICTFWGTILAVLLARFARRPARTYLVTTLILTAVSLIGPGAAAHTAGSTKVMLGLAHLIAAAIIVTTVTRRLATVPARADRRLSRSGAAASTVPARAMRP